MGRELTQPAQTGVVSECGRQLSGPLVCDLVVTQVQHLQRRVAAQSLAEDAERSAEHAHGVPLQSEAGASSRPIHFYGGNNYVANVDSNKRPDFITSN